MIIGLCGPMGSGKSTLANLLQCHALTHGKRARILHFADPLKDALRTLFLLSEAQLHGDLKNTQDPRWGKSPRQLMQWFATDVLREQFRDDFFVQHLLRRLPTCDDDILLVADVRFANEQRALKDHGATLLHLRRDDTHADTHASEHALDHLYIDAHLDNTTGTTHDMLLKAALKALPQMPRRMPTHSAGA